MFIYTFLESGFDTEETLIIPGCNGDEGSYGCCSDGITAATGPNQENCPGKALQGWYIFVILKSISFTAKNAWFLCSLIFYFYSILVYVSKCDMPKVPGYGNERLIHAYYDTSSKTCLPLMYSGRGGNENNFESIDQCEKECTQGMLGLFI